MGILDSIDLSILDKMIVKDKSETGITRAFYEKAASDYKQQLDLKKIDIGGGMLHDNYEHLKFNLKYS